ncbi:YaaC family protein [Micromonospora sp. NPDC020750]|uniref:YaaC family protein n=1 Tax=unclassified Micromonospora TaxID=2617518 RepID=UPI0037B0504B
MAVEMKWGPDLYPTSTAGYVAGHPTPQQFKIVLVRIRTDDIWSELRGTRYNPPGAAAGDDRRRATYVAALQQAEELFRAARTAGPASSPLLQFYGLSQAGRAIAAAAEDSGDGEWNLSGHGIQARNLTADLPDIAVLTDTADKPRSRQTSFVRLSLILGSPLWGKPQAPTFAQLWDTLPELINKPLRASGDRRTALIADPLSGAEQHPLVSADVSGIPGYLARLDATADGFHKFMAAYPTAVGYVPVTTQLGVPQYWSEAGYDTVRVRLNWYAGPKYPVAEEVRRDQLHAVLTPYGQGSYYLLPEVLPGTGPLHPLMAWWVVLYTLSMLARYQPAEWAACIDINASPYAAAVEYLLHESRTALPDLLLITLRQVAGAC